MKVISEYVGKLSVRIRRIRRVFEVESVAEEAKKMMVIKTVYGGIDVEIFAVRGWIGLVPICGVIKSSRR